MNTLIWPPQGRPTCHAVSSATPKVSVLGLPSASMSSASAMTSPSTQPPETDPSKRPSAATTICPPTPTGADPQVPTTVASATRPSLSSQDRAAFSTSCVASGRLERKGSDMARGSDWCRGMRGRCRRRFATPNINGGCAQHQRRRRRCCHAREDVRSIAVGDQALTSVLSNRSSTALRAVAR